MKPKTLPIIAVFAVAIVLLAAGLAYAAASPWAQSDWRGGSGQTAWSDATKFNSSSSVAVSASGVALSTASGWYNASWKYRQSLTITNNAGSALTDYQVPIYLNTATLISGSKMKSDCSDIRVVDASGNSLSYWIASAPTADTCNQTATKLWVKLSSLPTPSTTLYV